MANNNDIGLKRGTVKVVPYNPKWADLFEKERELLKKTFGSTIIAIEHVGSTSIPGMRAKPIIDMEIGVDSIETARSMGDKFEELGYEYRSLKYNQKTSKEVLFVKGPKENRTHHAHVTVFGSDFWKNDIAIRDYLIGNPGRAKQYAQLKKRLAQRYPDDRS